MPEAADVETDSDWAQCPLTRKSTSGLLAALGDHCIKTQSTLQSLITLSVAEPEYYAQVKGAALGISLCQMLHEWGVDVKLIVRSDLSSAKPL